MAGGSVTSGVVPVLSRATRQASRDRIVVPVSERIPRTQRPTTPIRQRSLPPPAPHPTPKRVSALSLPGRGRDSLGKESLISFSYNEDKGSSNIRGEDHSYQLSISKHGRFALQKPSLFLLSLGNFISVWTWKMSFVKSFLAICNIRSRSHNVLFPPFSQGRFGSWG